MFQINFNKLNLIVIEEVKINFGLIEEKKEIPIKLININIDSFYQTVREKLDSIVLVSCKNFNDILSLLESPEELSKNFLKEAILLCNDFYSCKEFFNKFPYTTFYFIPETDDEYINTKNLINVLINIHNSKFKIALEDEYLKLKQDLAELKFQNEQRIIQVEKYISDLEMKTLEYELLNSKLEKEIQLRKSYENELSKLNTTLQEYSLRLNEMIKELTTFNYTISHDLKAPLRGIIGYVKELKDEHLNQMELGERANHCILQIQKLSENMSQMIDDLLMYSKIGFEKPSFIKCDIEEIINSTLDDFSRQVHEKNAEIVLNLEIKEIFSWPRGLKQVFSNLIGNSLKYSKQGVTPKITISTKKIEENILIIVEDNGIGFDMIYAERIFQLFKRAVQDPKFQGTGVGLAIVHKIIEKLKGKIWAESELGVGTKFFIQLPLLEEL